MRPAPIRRGPLHKRIEAAEKAAAKDLQDLVRALAWEVESAWVPGGSASERSIRARVRSLLTPRKRRSIAEVIVRRGVLIGSLRAEEQAPKRVLARADRSRRDRDDVIGRIAIGRVNALADLLLDLGDDLAARAANAPTLIAFEEAVDVVLRRAKLIGETETHQAVGASQRARLAELGATAQAVWRTQLDDRVRPEHAEREGKVFDLDEGIDGELPGDPPNCRCWAEPIWPDSADGDDDG